MEFCFQDKLNYCPNLIFFQDFISTQIAFSSSSLKQCDKKLERFWMLFLHFIFVLFIF